MSDKATLSEIREAYVRPQGLFGHYGAYSRGEDFDAMIAEIELAAAEKALTDAADAVDPESTVWVADESNPRGGAYWDTNDWLHARAEAYRREGKE